LAHAGDRLGEILHAGVRVDDQFGIVDPRDLPSWLGQMTFFDDADAVDWPADAMPPGRVFAFQVWTEFRIWWSSSKDGVAYLAWRPIDTTEWLIAMSAFEPKLTYIGNGHVWRFGKNVGHEDE